MQSNIRLEPQKYQITYYLEWGEVTQQKTLAPHHEWREYHEANKRLNLASKKEEDHDPADKELVEYFKGRYGELFFTDESPLMRAKIWGRLNTPYCNCRVTFEKIN